MVIACRDRLLHAAHERCVVSDKHADQLLQEARRRAERVQIGERLGVDDCRRCGHGAAGRARSGRWLRAPRLLRFRGAKLLQFVQQPRRLDRLSQEGIGAGFETFAAGFGRRVRGQDRHRQPFPAAGHEAQRPQRLDSPELRHVAVQEHDVVPLFLERVERLLAIVDHSGIMAAAV